MIGDEDGIDIGGMFSREYAEAVAELGRFNLAVFGKTGAGKSTLINAVFGQVVAPTGTGSPVTADLAFYQHQSGLLGLLDSQGFETGQSGDTVLARLGEIVTAGRQQSVDRQIHAAWYVLRWSDRRFEQGQAMFVNRLAELVPVIVVLTQVPVAPDGSVHGEALELAAYIESLGLPIAPSGRVILTNALADPFLRTPVYGLQTLIEATFQTAPEAARRALSAAQLIDRERKRQACQAIIKKASTTAVATGVTPIPFSDAAILVPLQISMMAKIAAAYGVALPKSRIASVVGSLMLSSGATSAGRWLVSSLLRAVPGGQLPAMVISGAVAGSLTSAMGWAWVRVCEYVQEDSTSGLFDRVVVEQVFRDEFKARFRLPRGSTS
ncbi:MAG: DUF697 domain-containing protein [Candidatus Nanopelagicales bacterium]|nr:DUF697 domain-containing protein [Candidatus Nanopelagicales bacterium]